MNELARKNSGAAARSGNPLVSAVVSTYNAECLMRGKLEDLEAQTIAHELEIIVVDSGSQQNERAIVEEFQRRYDNIRYLRTERETVYQAWNRGIREARGEFVTNANTDDRLRRDAYETMVHALRERPDCVLAYPDMRITREENGTFERHEPHGHRKWPEFDRSYLMEVCCVGPFPLWRRSLHDDIGYFDERFRSIADYEFWLRAALQHDFIHVPQFLGLYYLSPETVSRKGDLPSLEYLQIQQVYRPKYARFAPAPGTLTPEQELVYQGLAAASADASPQRIADLDSFAASHPRWPQVHHDLAELHWRRGDIGSARHHFEKAALLHPASPHAERLQEFLRGELSRSLQQYGAPGSADELERQLILGMICLILGRHDEARSHYLEAVQLDPGSAPARGNLSYLEAQLLVSVVVLVSSELDLTRECLESIARNTAEPHELVVVASGCGAETTGWLREFCAARPRRSFADGGGAGFAAACNIGMRGATGRHIALLRSDVVVTRGWLSGLFLALKRHGRPAIVAPMLNEAPGAQHAAVTGYRNLAELEECAASFRARHLGRRFSVDGVAPSALLFPRELLAGVGEFDTRFSSDTLSCDDFSLRAALEGVECVIAGDVFLHRYPACPSKADGSSRAAVRERFVFEEKWHPAALDEATARKVTGRSVCLAARRLARQGWFHEAVDLLLKQGIALAPQGPETYRLLAQILLEGAHCQEALEVLLQAQEPEHPALLELKAAAMAAVGRSEQAVALADQALLLAPSSTAALQVKGKIALDKGDHAEAEALFRRAILADPGFGPAFAKLSDLVWERGELKEALELAEIGFVLSPLDMASLDHFHRYASACDELPREEQRVREARAIYPEHKGLAFGLIEILIRDGRYGEAIDEIQRCAVDFGLDDAAIDAALEIRRLAGPAPAAQRGIGSVSVCMIVKNEARQLPAALFSVKGLADEVVVVDTGSTDRTCDIARIFGARLFSFKWTGSFSEARNFGLARAEGDWILIFDADEVFSPRDLGAIASLLAATVTPTAYSLPIRNYTSHLARKDWSPNLGEYPAEERGRGWTPSQRARLFPNDARIRFEGVVHELLEPSIMRCGIRVAACDIPVHHYGKLDEEKVAEKRVIYYELGMKKLSQGGETLQALLELAVQATELQKFQDAEGLWHRVLEHDPQLAEAWFNLGYIYLTTGNYQRARAHTLRATELEPELKEAKFNLGKCELFLGMAPVALSRSQEMLARWPDYPPALSLLCAALLVSERTTEAESVLEKVQRMGFDCGDFLREYAGGLSKAGLDRLAAPLLDYAERLTSQHDPGLGLGLAGDHRHAI